MENALSNYKPFSLLIKPASADCNLACTYCFYLDHCKLYPEKKIHRMSFETLETMIKKYMSTPQPVYSFGWQGGEPTLMGLDFFKKVVSLQQKYGRYGSTVANGLQTNGILINKEFAKFLSQYNFLVGISLDGPPEIHNCYRKFPNGEETHSYVMQGIKNLQENNVEFNILVLVNNLNVKKPKEIYYYLLDNQFYYHQYIECVEFDEKGNLLPYSIQNPEDWGNFLCEIFDEWYKHHIRKVSIRLFDSILTYLVEKKYIVCQMDNNCCQYFVIEYNGDVYPCDFFVEKELKIGNIHTGDFKNFLTSPIYLKFGKQKSNYNDLCKNCKFLKYCHGDCQKHRYYGEKNPKNLSFLCKGWKIFYEHALPKLKKLANKILEERQKQLMYQFSYPKKIGRNDPCPCGSGKKYKNCCMNKNKKN